MTKDEIKKALECCASNIDWLDCNDCPYFKHHCGRGNKLMQDALNIINEQEKEIDRLKVDYSKLQEMFANYQLASDKEIIAQVKQAKIDVLNELRETHSTSGNTFAGWIAFIPADDIDEMIEELNK